MSSLTPKQLEKQAREIQLLAKSLAVNPDFISAFNPNLKVHRNLADKAIRFCLNRLERLEDDGFFTAHDNKVLRPIFNHHQSEIGKTLIEDLILVVKPHEVERDPVTNEITSAKVAELDIHIGHLTKLIEIYTSWKLDNLKKKDMKDVTGIFSGTNQLKSLIKKNFPKLAEKIFNKEEEISSTSSLSSSPVLLSIDFTSFAQEKLQTVRTVNVVITYHKELNGKKSWEYKDKSHRLWHDVQQVKRELKAEIFSQHLKFDYDLATAAIRVLYFKVKAMDKNFEASRFPLVLEYINNRSKVRWKIAEKFGITYDQAKDLFSYLGNNGVLTTSYKRGLFKITKNPDIAQAMVDDPYVKSFSKEVERLWEKFVYQNNREALWNGNTKFSQSRFTGALQVKDLDELYVSNQQQYQLYFRVEREMLEIMREYMEKKCADIFLEHDGFRSSLELTEQELAEIEQLILEKTQVKVKLESNEQKTENLQPTSSSLTSSSSPVLLSIDFTFSQESPAARAFRLRDEQTMRNKVEARQKLDEYELALA